MLEKTLLQSTGAIAVNLAAKKKETLPGVDFGAIVAEIAPVQAKLSGNFEPGFADTPETAETPEPSETMEPGETAEQTETAAIHVAEDIAMTANSSKVDASAIETVASAMATLSSPRKDMPSADGPPEFERMSSRPEFAASRFQVSASADAPTGISTTARSDIKKIQSIASAPPEGETAKLAEQAPDGAANPRSADHREVPTGRSETATTGNSPRPVPEGMAREGATDRRDAPFAPTSSEMMRPPVAQPREMASMPPTMPRTGPAMASAVTTENVAYTPTQMSSIPTGAISHGGVRPPRDEAEPRLAAAARTVSGPAIQPGQPQVQTPIATGRPEQTRFEVAAPTTATAGHPGRSETPALPAATRASETRPRSIAEAASPIQTPPTGPVRPEGARTDGPVAPALSVTTSDKPVDAGPSPQPSTRPAVDRIPENMARMTEAVSRPSADTGWLGRTAAPEADNWRPTGQAAAPGQATSANVTAAAYAPAAQTPAPRQPPQAALLEDAAEVRLEPGAEMHRQVGEHGQSSVTQGSESRAQTLSPHRAEHIARQIAETLQRTGDRQAEIRLNPDELGRVKIHMATSDAGILMSVNAERPETLDLMRRHIDMLAKELEGMGYTDIQFSFGGEGAKGGHRPASGSGPAIHSEDATVQAPTPPNTPRIAGAGLDIRM